MTRTLLLPLRVVSEANAHTHWRVRQRRAKSQRFALALAWLAEDMPKGRKPTTVLLTRLAPRKLDSDNLAISCKHLRDAIAAECAFDDRDPDCAWLYAQEKAREYGVRCEIVWADAEVLP